MIAPSVILEEVELFGIEQERERKPFITAPHARADELARIERVVGIKELNLDEQR